MGINTSKVGVSESQPILHRPGVKATSSPDQVSLESHDAFEKSGPSTPKLMTLPAQWLRPECDYYEDYQKALSVPHVLTDELLTENKGNIDFYTQGPIRIGRIEPGDNASFKVGQYYENLQALALQIEESSTKHFNDLPASDKIKKLIREGDPETLHHTLDQFLKGQGNPLIKIPHGKPSPLGPSWEDPKYTPFPPELWADYQIAKAEKTFLTPGELEAKKSEAFFTDRPVRLFNHILIMKAGEKAPSIEAHAGDYFKNFQHLALRFRQMQTLKELSASDKLLKAQGHQTSLERQIENIEKGDLNAIHQTLQELVQKFELHFPKALELEGLTHLHI